jgi:hypothetical protein
VTVQTFILSFSFAFAQSIAKSVSRCTAARKTLKIGSWPAIERPVREEVTDRRFVGPAKLLRTKPTKKLNYLRPQRAEKRAFVPEFTLPADRLPMEYVT